MPVSWARANLGALIRWTARTGERTVVTDRGHAVAVLVSAGELACLEDVLARCRAGERDCDERRPAPATGPADGPGASTRATAPSDPRGTVPGPGPAPASDPDGRLNAPGAPPASASARDRLRRTPVSGAAGREQPPLRPALEPTAAASNPIRRPRHRGAAACARLDAHGADGPCAHGAGDAGREAESRRVTARRAGAVFCGSRRHRAGSKSLAPAVRQLADSEAGFEEGAQ